MIKQGNLMLRVMALALCFSISAIAQKTASPLPDGVMIKSTTVGNVLTDSRGMTLYTLDKDTADKSVCNNECAALWPPLLAKDGTKAPANWSVITRDDGAKQWAHQGKAAIYLCQRLEAGRRDREWLFWWRMARCEKLVLQASGRRSGPRLRAISHGAR